ncbi:S8/S53 family peptidase [Deinococcus depolymerans]|uniref:Peptidase S8/S53 domain-containing protein n=1 Tax=Deinococcus depolymerans TaxID=392408 RepID=A0ABN1BHF8_9DEIO
MIRTARCIRLPALLLLLLLGAARAQSGATAVTAVRTAGVYPAAAAPGETAWIFGLNGVAPEGKLNVGGQATGYRLDRASGWLAFQVPPGAAGGPQLLTLSGAPQPLRLNVLTVPPGTDALVYVRPDAAKTVQAEYTRRLQAVQETCARSCPAEVQAVLKRLSAQPFPALTPITPPVKGQGVTPGLAARVTVTPTQAIRAPLIDLTTLKTANLTRLLNPPARPATAPTDPICSALAGNVPTTGLPLGQVLTLLELIFAGDLQTDPTRVGWPDQANEPPLAKTPPATVLGRLLNLRGGSGRGVTIHVLDTASAAEDPFTYSGQYYAVTFTDRPHHGRAIGEIAQTVAPGAAVQYRQVCDRDGTCSTLKTVQALCAVADEARRGGRHVVNLSVGGPNPTRGLELALREVAALGVPTTASYGNRDDCAGLVAGDRCNHYPADWTRAFEFGPSINLASRSLRPTMLLSVAGWDIAGQQLATYNRGTGNPGVPTEAPSVQAPGEFWLGSPMYPYFGTSFAAPVVSGVLANWMSCRPGVPLLPLITTPGQVPIAPGTVNACP